MITDECILIIDKDDNILTSLFVSIIKYTFIILTCLKFEGYLLFFLLYGIHLILYDNTFGNYNYNYTFYIDEINIKVYEGNN